MSTIKTYVRDLTNKDKENLRKFIGTKSRPYPMRKSAFVEGSKGESVYERKIGLLASETDPLTLWSERDYAEVMGMALRDMPTPGMLPLFFDAIARRKPENKRTLQYLKGAPGAGKTFMSELIGRMQTPEGAIKIDCGNKNLSELLFETVLDLNANRTFYDELDKRLANGKLNPLSLKELNESLGEAFIKDGDTITIDWGLVGKNLHDTDGGIMESEKATKIALEALRRVSELEGIASQSGNSLGMATQEGALITAWKEGRPIILDEFNRHKEGTTAPLHGVLQFLAGELDSVTVENTLKEKGDDVTHHFVFKREDQRVGFSVTLTGNAEEDGSDVEELPESLNSRIVPQTVPVATEEDWQHRMCQIMTGLPVSTLYTASEEQWENDPDAFREQLKHWRTLGLSKEYIEANKDEIDFQLQLLDRWEDILEATGKLSKFYFDWSKIVNPDSEFFREGGFGHLFQEIDERYKAEVAIDFRKITLHVQEASQDRPEIIDAEESDGFEIGDWNKQPGDVQIMGSKDKSFNFGSNLVETIMKYVNDTTIEIGKSGTHELLIKHARDCGLIAPKLAEGRANKQRTVAELLNNNPYKSPNIRIQARLVRDILCDYLRDTYPDVTADNDDLMPVSEVEAILDMLGEDVEELLDIEANSGQILLINEDMESMFGMPFMRIESVDMTPSAFFDATAKSLELSVAPSPEELVTEEAFMATLAMPRIRDINLKGIWNKALSKSGHVVSQSGDVKDEALAMAEGDSASGLAVTTIMVNSGDKQDSTTNEASELHVVHNQKTGQTLVVGNGLKKGELTQAFQHASITYVNRNDKSAEKDVQNGLCRVMKDMDKEFCKTLKQAFLLRNDVAGKDDESSLSFEKLLVSKDVKCFLPKFIKNGPKTAGS